jgi:hypothetical protein
MKGNIKSELLLLGRSDKGGRAGEGRVRDCAAFCKCCGGFDELIRLVLAGLLTARCLVRRCVVYAYQYGCLRAPLLPFGDIERSNIGCYYHYTIPQPSHLNYSGISHRSFNLHSYLVALKKPVKARISPYKPTKAGQSGSVLAGLKSSVSSPI